MGKEVESHSDTVSREEHDAAVTALRNEISELKVLVADLERIVTQPEGAVTFHEILPGEHVPWYNAEG